MGEGNGPLVFTELRTTMIDAYDVSEKRTLYSNWSVLSQLFCESALLAILGYLPVVHVENIVNVETFSFVALY